MPKPDTRSSPRVSVIIIFLDGERYLDASIQSVLDQTYRDFELILVDDGSGAAATTIAREHAARDPDRVRYIEHPGHINCGMSASRNAGIAMARGELIAFNDADDVWLAEKLADQVALADAHPDAAMIAGGANYWETWSDLPWSKDRIVYPGIDFDTVVPAPEALLATYPLGSAEAPCPSTLLCRKTALEAIGGFEESYRGMYEDQAFLAKMYLRFPVVFPRACWLNYRQHPDSCSSEIGRQGTLFEIRTRHYRWLRDYFTAQGVTDARLFDRLALATRKHRVAVVLFRVRRFLARFLPAATIRRLKRWTGYYEWQKRRIAKAEAARVN